MIVTSSDFPQSGFLHRAIRLLGPGDADETALRQAAWVARCVGRGDTSPLGSQDVTALAGFLRTRDFARGERLFGSTDDSRGVWIIRRGRIELTAGSGRRRSVVHVLHPGDVDGDIQHLLDMPFPYTGRALDEGTALLLDTDGFERLLAERPAISRRWLSSIAQRLATSQQRVLGLLGRSLPQQVARLLLDEAVAGQVLLPQRTLAAMIGVQRPSLNKILKDFEHRELITIGYAAIELRDIEGLEKRAVP
ncbi:cyclic nucleotide-binding domain-containing protein [Actinopolyspora mortivallis]|uniref:Crp/Fnr family transcriptional regulator n=1 Tax=Actinopolyspora mortivallis TaxID=33906 RepID=UPI00037C93CC